MDNRKKGTLILTSLLEDLELSILTAIGLDLYFKCLGKLLNQAFFNEARKKLNFLQRGQQQPRIWEVTSMVIWEVTTKIWDIIF